MHFTPFIAFAILSYAGSAFSAPHVRGPESQSPSHCGGPQGSATSSMAIPVLDADNSPPPAPASSNGVAAAGTAKAIYFITNSANNYIVAVHVGANGLLTGSPVLTPTGGSGLSGMTATAKRASPDSLFSQDSLTVSGNLLFAVNSGSNTLSMFMIDSQNPCKLTPVGTPQSTGGQFPQSVTYSAKLSTACVNNSGAVDGVSCFKVNPQTGLSKLDASPRPFGLGQSTPPLGPTQTASDLLFNEDSSALLVTVKGNPANNFTGFLAAYPVVNGVVSQQPVKSNPAGTAVLFGFSLLSPTTMIATDASFGAAILSIDSALTATTQSRIVVANSTAVCWSAFSPSTGSAYVTDVLQNRIGEINTQTGQLVQIFDVNNGNLGNTDTAVAGNFLYALSPANNTHVAVMDISGGAGKIVAVQNFGIAGLPGMGSAAGMTTFPKAAAA
ncbi:hypothetical protein RUND412_002402 [Rhizina undulata]